MGAFLRGQKGRGTGERHQVDCAVIAGSQLYKLIADDFAFTQRSVKEEECE